MNTFKGPKVNWLCRPLTLQRIWEFCLIDFGQSLNLTFHTLTGGRSKMTMSLEKLPPLQDPDLPTGSFPCLMKLCQQAIATNLKISILKWFGSCTKKTPDSQKRGEMSRGNGGVTLPQRLPSHDPGSADNPAARNPRKPNRSLVPTAQCTRHPAPES